MELHAGSLLDQFGRDKMVALAEQDYSWPQLCPRCRSALGVVCVCSMAKGQIQNTGLNTPLPILEGEWEEVSMDFVLGLLRIEQGMGNIFFYGG